MRPASDLCGVPGPATAQVPLPSLDSVLPYLGFSSFPPPVLLTGLLESEHGNRQASLKYCSNLVSQ